MTWEQAVDGTPHLRRAERPPTVPDRDAQSQKIDTQYIKALQIHVAALLEDLAAERVILQGGLEWLG